LESKNLNLLRQRLVTIKDAQGMAHIGDILEMGLETLKNVAGKGTSQSFYIPDPYLHGSKCARGTERRRQ